MLRTEIEADASFMRAQFDADVAGHSQMAMLVINGLNLELFEHHVGPKQPPRPADRIGGNTLTLRGTNRPCRFPRRFGITSDVEGLS